MANTKFSISSFVSAVILFYMAMPYFVWHGFVSSIYVKTILGFIAGGLFFVNRRKLSSRERFLFLLLLVALLLYLVLGGHNFNFFLTVFPVAFLPFAKESYSRSVYSFFLIIYVFFVGIGLLSWLGALIGIIPPIGSIEALNSMKSYNYSVYPFFVSLAGFPLLRFHGPFDEPGVVGTISGILLCIEQFNFKNKKSIILLLSGLCSLSLFFYVLLGVYYIMYYALKKRGTLRTVFAVALVLGGFMLIQRVPVLQEAVGARLEWDSERGTLVGDNRINNEIAQDYLNSIAGTRQFWFGIDDKEGYLDSIAGSSSFVTVILLNGMVFVILYLLFFILYANYYRRQWSSVILFLVVFISTIYQRPNTFQMLYMFLFTYLAKIDSIMAATEKQPQTITV